MTQTLWPEMKLKPTTVDEVNDVQTPEGMRRRLRKYRGNNALVGNLLTAAEMRGMSGEDTMTWLAYEALLYAELLKDQLLEFHATNPMPPIMKE